PVLGSRPEVRLIDLSEDQIAVIRRWAETTPEIACVILYGSRAKGTARPDSDVDLGLITFGPEPGSRFANFGLHRREWANQLQELVGLKVQLEYASPEIDDFHIREYIETGHVVLFCRNSDKG